MRTRLVTLAALSLALAACGSKPVLPPPVVSQTQNFMAKGMLAYNDNRYAEARGWFGRAFAEYRSVDDQDREVDALTDLADAALQEGDVPSARDSIKQARDILATHPVAGLPERLSLLEAYADLESQDPASAIVVLGPLLTDNAAGADVQRAALFARTQAAFDSKAGDAAQWLAKLGKGQDDLDQARLERLQALAASDSGNAASLYASALHRYQLHYYRPGIAAVHEEWGALLLSQQKWAEARDHLQRALDIRLWMYDGSRSARILTQMQQADTALGNADQAKQDGVWSDYLKNGGDPSKSPVAPAAVTTPSN
ncbi:MAG TPA: hypothetical protein VLV87_12200 [Gammaproteobacteria bacterium]|nr:hypothetical protein [Gammaproteobacteria bacterium]